MAENFRDVLLVDDSTVIRTLVGDILKAAGFRVRLAENGAEGLKKIEEECPHIVITDWVMSPIDGIEFCRRLRELSLPHYVYVTLLTAKAREEALLAGLGAGADDFLAKPLNRGELSLQLENALRILGLESRLQDLTRGKHPAGILNRRAFHELFQQEWSRAARYRHPLSCVMVDIEPFEKASEFYGRRVGDHVLRFLAQSLEEQSRSPAYVCRWSGQKFCVLTPSMNEQQAGAWAERCFWALAEAESSIDENSFTMIASFGVAGRQDYLPTSDQLLRRAEQALHAAKRAGRHRVASFESLASEPVFLVSEPETTWQSISAN